MNGDDGRLRSTEEWNRIDRGEHDGGRGERGNDPLAKTDNSEEAPTSGAGSEPPD